MNQENTISINDLRNVVRIFEKLARKGMIRDFDLMEEIINLRKKILAFCATVEMTVRGQMVSQQSQNTEENNSHATEKNKGEKT